MRYMNLYLRASVPQLETFLAVKKVIDEWDPLHLFPSAPLDEYEYEVLRICQRLNVCPPYRDVPTTEELARFIGDVCCEWQDSLGMYAVSVITILAVGKRIVRLPKRLLMQYRAVRAMLVGDSCHCLPSVLLYNTSNRNEA